MGFRINTRYALNCNHGIKVYSSFKNEVWRDGSIHTVTEWDGGMWAVVQDEIKAIEIIKLWGERSDNIFCPQDHE